MSCLMRKTAQRNTLLTFLDLSVKSAGRLRITYTDIVFTFLPTNILEAFIKYLTYWVIGCLLPLSID